MCVQAGLPPQPRYGHALVTVHSSDKDKRRKGTAKASSSSGPAAVAGRDRPELDVLVVGGCAVNPVSEISGAAEGPIGVSVQNQIQAKKLAHLNQQLQVRDPF